MHKRTVREIVNQLIESDFDQRDLQSRLTRFDQTNDSPRAPSEFDTLQSFESYYEQKQGYEYERQDLQTRLDNAKIMYDLAVADLEDMLPTNTPLHYDYEGARQELAGVRSKIVNQYFGSGKNTITISPTGPPSQ